eukprot:TRINITY_DN1918_c0_g1_i1.p1 TRINITY_DN1918_c0_g1~~TRINITY_DN1918_c0_g1_i1.p1  ORF type:complete len:297 (+),score=74.48 TRINITY_DN1918_c0_g1_i1:71-961(+)
MERTEGDEKTIEGENPETVLSPKETIDKLSNYFSRRLGKAIGSDIPILLDPAKETFRSCGVTALINNYGRFENNWTLKMEKSDHKLQFYREWDPNSPRQKHHDSAMSIVDMLLHLELNLVATELPICGFEDPIPQIPNGKHNVIPIGSIDVVCYDPKISSFVLCDFKTLISKYDSELDKLILRQDHAIQLSFYCYILEKMAKMANLNIHIDYFLLFGYDPNGGRIGAWKIFRNDQKWLGAKGLEKHWQPLLSHFQDEKTIQVEEEKERLEKLTEQIETVTLLLELVTMKEYVREDQ